MGNNKMTEPDKKEIGWEKILTLLAEEKDADEVLEREVTKHGNSGHIAIPSKHLGKIAKIIIRKKEEEKKSN